jgi:hypothetical protein
MLYQSSDGDHAEHAVEGEQEQAHHEEADQHRDQALVERRLAECGRNLRLGDQFELDRQRAGLELVGEILCRGQREAAGYLRAGGGIDPFGVFGEVDRGRGDDLVVEHHGEVLLGLFLGDSGQLRCLAAFGDFARHTLER